MGSVATHCELSTTLLQHQRLESSSSAHLGVAFEQGEGEGLGLADFAAQLWPAIPHLALRLQAAGLGAGQ